MNSELVSILCTGLLVGYLVLHIFFRVAPTIKGVTALLGTAFGGVAFTLFKSSPYVWFCPIAVFAGGVMAAGVYYGGRRQLRQRGTIEIRYIGQYEINYPQPYKAPPHLEVKRIELKKGVIQPGEVSFKITKQSPGGFTFDVTSYTAGDELQWEARGVRAAE